MTLRKTAIVLAIISCVSLLLVCITAWYITPKKLDTTQDELEWSKYLQKQREQRSREAGRESFERLDRIYGDPNDKF